MITLISFKTTDSKFEMNISESSFLHVYLFLFQKGFPGAWKLRPIYTSQIFEGN